MKKYFSFAIFISLLKISDAFSYDAIIIVLEAPLLKEPRMESLVLQTLRQGQKVYVPREIVESEEKIPEFIPTFDRAGNRAYIPAQYVKVVTNDNKEFSQPITFIGHDPTDYRLEEPIPVTYPFSDNNHLRVSAAFIVGNNTKSPYDYNRTYSAQEYRSELGGRLALTRKVVFDQYDRFYFGFLGFTTSSRNTVQFKNNFLAEEKRSILRGGPYLTYDTFKNQKYRISVGTGFTYNYHKSALFVSDESGSNSEERLFSGYSFSPVATTGFQVNDILPNTDLVAGADLSLFLPFTQTSKDATEIPGLWGESSEIKSSMKAQTSLYFGIQVKY